MTDSMPPVPTGSGEPPQTCRVCHRRADHPSPGPSEHDAFALAVCCPYCGVAAGYWCRNTLKTYYTPAQFLHLPRHGAARHVASEGDA